MAGAISCRIYALAIRSLHETAPCTGGVHQPRNDGGSVDLPECGIVETA